MAGMKFGVDVPTCLAGMAYPVPFATAHEVVRIAVEAEQLGYHEVSGNDHLSTQRFVRDAWPEPPDYFEPLMMLADQLTQLRGNGPGALQAYVRNAKLNLFKRSRQLLLLGQEGVK